MRSYATITTHAALNYGAVLQAYALCQYLREQDKDCLVLNYVPDHVLKNYRLIETPRSIKELFVSGFQALHYQAKKRRRERFEAFRNSYIPLSGPRIPDHSALIEAANQYDTVICGSDQIWNPETHGFDEGYFLSFPQITTNRISYAASFGVDTIRDEIKPELSRRLAGFSSFASRERSGQQFIRELTGKEATMVLDPVFLLSPDHWRKLAKPVETGTPYALVYFLSNPGTSPFAIKRYASEHALQTLSIGFSPRDRKYGLTRDYSLALRNSWVPLILPIQF